MEIGMEFDRFPTFFENGRANEMETGNFGVESKILGNEALLLECSFLQNAGEWAAISYVNGF